jgi:hypothetical protein
MSDGVLRVEDGEDSLEPFWAWFDPLLEDHFALAVSDPESAPLLERLALEGVAPIQVQARGMVDAIEKAFPDHKHRMKVSSRRH